MSDETSTTVKTVSDGAVKISLEMYNELLAKAAEKTPVVYKQVVKTAEMAAADHKAWGWTFIGAGAALVGIGAIRLKLSTIEP